MGKDREPSKAETFLALLFGVPMILGLMIGIISTIVLIWNPTEFVTNVWLTSWAIFILCSLFGPSFDD